MLTHLICWEQDIKQHIQVLRDEVDALDKSAEGCNALTPPKVVAQRRHRSMDRAFITARIINCQSSSWPRHQRHRNHSCKICCMNIVVVQSERGGRGSAKVML